jgi:hypothetical protein
MVRSNLEYCSSIWAPHTKQHIDKIESVQRRAARYVTKGYHNTANDLNWSKVDAMSVACDKEFHKTTVYGE